MGLHDNVGHEVLQLRQVLGDTFEQEVRLATRRVAFANRRPQLDRLFERFDVAIGLRGKAGEDEGEHLETELLGIEFGAVAANDAFVL